MNKISFQESSRTIYVVLPCYNEQDNLISLFQEFERIFDLVRNLGLKHKYIVVDDGSKDDSYEILTKISESVDLEIIQHNPNQGLGMTIKDGLKRASEVMDGNDIVVTMDSDNTQPASLLFSMVMKILEGNHVVIASRYRYGAKVVGLSSFRIFLSYGAGLLFKFAYNIKDVKDYTCGFRAYDGSILKKAFKHYGDEFIEQRGFQCMAEILLKLHKLDKNMIFSEVPMVLRYDLKQGESKMKVSETIFNTIKMLVSYKFKR
jgi:dolichol-phosphate mannosyltransferase